MIHKSSIWDSAAANALLQYINQDILSIIFEFANRSYDRWIRNDYSLVVEQISVGAVCGHFINKSVKSIVDHLNFMVKLELKDEFYLSALYELEGIHIYSRRYNVPMLQVVDAFDVGRREAIHNHVRKFYFCLCKVTGGNFIYPGLSRDKHHYRVQIHVMDSYITHFINMIYNQPKK